MPTQPEVKPRTVQAIQNLQAVKVLLSDFHRWATGAFARDRLHNRVLFDSPNATCWCIAGALGKVTNLQGKREDLIGSWGMIMSQPGWAELSEAAHQAEPSRGAGSPSRVNDCGDHKLVLKMLDTAIDLAKERHANRIKV